MQVSPLISVIVPIYNVAPYLRQCLDSLVGQSYKQLDIILINDGSTDESGAIADEYAFADERIRVIHKENGGLSSARNHGLDIARGEYISYVDSDDWLELDTYTELVKVLVESPDLDVLKFLPIKKPRHERSRGLGRIRYYSGAETLDAYLNGEIAAAVWNAVYKRSAVEELRFVEGYYCEDVHYTLSLFAKPKLCVAQMSRRYYHYRINREGSIMSKGTRLVHDLVALWQMLLSPDKVYEGRTRQGFEECYIRTLATQEQIMLRELSKGKLSNQAIHERREAIALGWHYAQNLGLDNRDKTYGWLTSLYLRYPHLYWLLKRPSLYIKYKGYLVHH